MDINIPLTSIGGATGEDTNKSKDSMQDLVIIGAGCAGLAAGMYAARFNMKTLIIGESLGGLIILTDIVENYPGFEKLTGSELAEKLRKHALAAGAKIMNEKVEAVEKVKGKDGFKFRIKTLSNEYLAKSIIFATGTKVRKLGVPGEEEYANKGVHYCALCDGPFYKGKRLAVVGGSDSAAKEALVLTQFAEKVYIIYRREKIRAEPVNYDRVMKLVDEGKIEIINNANITRIEGGKFVEKAILDREYNGSREFPIDGIFVEIGHIPLTALAEKIGVKTNKKGEIIINRDAETNVEGVFAAGDCVDTRFKQAIVGVGEGVVASYSAYTFLKGMHLID